MAIDKTKTSDLLRIFIYSFLVGLFGIIVSFIAGSWSGSSAYAVLAVSAGFLFANTLLVKKFPFGKWFSGAVINLPIFVFFIFVAEPGQFKSNFGGLATCLTASYLGSFAGRWLHGQKPKTYMRVLALALPISIVLLAILFFVVQKPTPIPGDKQLFVGEWKTLSGFKLEIRADGTARIINNGLGAPNLNIPNGPEGIIDGFNAQIIGDSVLEIAKPSYYAKDYKIDSNPKLENLRFTLILNGTILVQ